MLLKKFSPSGLRFCIALLLAFYLPEVGLLAQNPLPVVGASSHKVTIKDGYVIREGVWNLSPEIKPDVYNALKSNTQKTVTFYTDTDSISFNVVPGHEYDFVILLNNKDSCLTRISAENLSVSSTSGMGLPISPEMLAMDFVVFRDQLRKHHPGLYRYKPKKDINRLMDSCLLSIDKPLTQLEFGKTILFVTSRIQDGHTGTNISSLLMRNYQESTKLFPIYLYFVGNKAFVSCSKTNQFQVGTEILAINDESIFNIRKKLFKYLPSDGSIETKKYHTLNSNGAFPFLYKWVYGHEDMIAVKYKDLNGQAKTTNVAAQLARDFECEMKNLVSETKDLNLKYLNDQTGLLTIRTFDENRLKRNGIKFVDFLDKAFLELLKNKPKNLIIDLRGNAGGLDQYGSLLYSYLTDKPFKYYRYIQSTDGDIPASENQMLGSIRPQEASFKGRVFILINGLSFSTTAEFCAIARSNNRAIFVGEETSGAYYGNTSGQTIKVELPNSKINIVIPRFSYVNDVKKAKYPDRGVLPDYPVSPTVHNIAEGNDVQLKYAIDLAGRP